MSNSFAILRRVEGGEEILEIPTSDFFEDGRDTEASPRARFVFKRDYRLIRATTAHTN